MLRTGTLLVAAALVLAAGTASAQVSVGAVGSLYIQPGARPAGMGDCFVALSDDATACWWNPAGLAFLERKHNIALMHTQLVPDWDDVYYEYAAYAIRVEGLGTIGASLIYLSYGEQTATSPDPGEPPLGTFLAYEVVPSVAYGATIGENLAVGINLKFAYANLAPGEYTVDRQDGVGTTFAGDLGVLYRTPGGRMNLGAAVQNVGPRIAYIDEEQADPLPRNFKGGVTYRLLSDETNRLIVSGEFNKLLVIVEDIFDPSTGIVLGAGAEYAYYDMFALRAGYVHDKDGKVMGVSWGLGLKYKSAAFDFATVPQAEGLKRPFRFSLTAAF